MLNRRTLARKRALVPVLIALGLVVAHAAMLLHLTVPHATCEHGDVVETGHPAHEAPRAERTGRDGVERAAAHDDGHDHCNALAVWRPAPELAPQIPPASRIAVLLPPARSGSERRPVALLSLAPKCSPPC